MTRFLLIRHGESSANRKQLFAGHYDAELEKHGVLQARLTAKFIAENFEVDKIYSSDLKRAYRTAEEIASALQKEVIPSQDLREINAGFWEGLGYADLEKHTPKEYEIWRNDIGHAVCPQGESVAHLGERIMAELTRIANENDGKTVAIATHATPIRATQSIIAHGSVDEMKNIPWVSNASVTIYEYDCGKWSIAAASLDKHLGDTKTVLPSYA